MYRSCIFCSAGLGGNDALERFPVGRSIAFDARKGRLWAVCPKCARWNLAPLEERWEAVEDAERLFRDTRMRVQRENIGMARLPDGTRLVRVGEAVPGEMAAWRYGGELIRRSSRIPVVVGAHVAFDYAAATLLLMAAPGVPAVLGVVVGLGVSRWIRARPGEAVIHRTAEGFVARRKDLVGGWLALDEDGSILLKTQASYLPALRDDEAAAALVRGLVGFNTRGAGRRSLRRAVALLTEAGSPRAYVAELARRETTLRPNWTQASWDGPGITAEYWEGRARAKGLSDQADHRFWNTAYRLERHSVRGGQPEMLALEMALHDETERRAMDGELAALEAMWRQAEEIAGIADRLPDGVPATIPPKM